MSIVVVLSCLVFESKDPGDSRDRKWVRDCHFEIDGLMVDDELTDYFPVFECLVASFRSVQLNSLSLYSLVYTAPLLH